MIILNLIGAEDNEHIDKLFYFYQQMGVFVVYSDDLENESRARLASELQFSVAHSIDRIPFQYMRYQMSWHHLRQVGATHEDWIIVAHTNEMLLGLSTLPDLEQTHAKVGLVKVYQKNNINDEFISIQPRIFRFEPFGDEFYAGNCWPSYVDHLIERKHNLLAIDDIAIFDLELLEMLGENE